MWETRRRKVPKDEDTHAKRKAKFAQGSQLKSNRSKFYLLTAMVLVTCLAAYYYIFEWSSTYTHSSTFIDTLSLSLGLKNYIYSVVIDAGSTGSRVLTYGFISSKAQRGLFKLDTEFFKEVKPGISAYAKNPQEVKNSLDSLLKEAQRIVPPEEQWKTSLVMKATAGLRLLPTHQADALLNESRKYLKESGFKVDDDSVSILDGSDEGLLSWFTVNFLLDRLGRDKSKTVVALDLGGGSTQVSFVPLRTDFISPTQKKYLNEISAFHEKLKVYSRSYLGLGLNEGRMRVLLHNSNHSLFIQSECINPLVKTKWTYRGVEYNITGPKNSHYSQTESRGEKFVTPIVDYQECRKVVRAVISQFKKAPSLADKEIYAFSYYYDRAADSGLIEYKKNGKVTVKEFIIMAKTKCAEANVDQPFLCLDLVYISTLLTELYSIPECGKINVVKALNGHEVSWALGAAFLNLQSKVL